MTIQRMKLFTFTKQLTNLLEDLNASQLQDQCPIPRGI